MSSFLNLAYDPISSAKAWFNTGGSSLRTRISSQKHITVLRSASPPATCFNFGKKLWRKIKRLLRVWGCCRKTDGNCPHGSLKRKFRACQFMCFMFLIMNLWLWILKKVLLIATITLFIRWISIPVLGIGISLFLHCFKFSVYRVFFWNGLGTFQESRLEFQHVGRGGRSPLFSPFVLGWRPRPDRG